MVGWEVSRRPPRRHGRRFGKLESRHHRRPSRPGQACRHTTTRHATEGYRRLAATVPIALVCDKGGAWCSRTLTEGALLV